jgi:O-antigen ligase
VTASAQRAKASKRTDLQATSVRRSPWPLRLTVIALPFSYVPHEVIRSGPSIGFLVLALVLVSGAYYGVLGRRLGALDTVTLLFAAYVVVRIGVLSPLQGLSGFDAQALISAGGTLLAGVLLFRLGRQAEHRATIVSALKFMVLLILLVEFYQVAAGLPRLFSLGYGDGFYFYTEGGDYRPFSTFLSPTVFGGYLAMVGSAVVLLSRGKRAAFWLAIVSVGLILTETRAAQIAFAAAMLLAWANVSRESRRRIVLVGIPTLYAALLVVLVKPSVIASQFGRLATLTDSNYTSNSARLHLWAGALEASRSSPIIGYPGSAFVRVLEPLIGPDALFGHAHSNYLQVLFLYGYAGLALFIVVLVLAATGISQSLKRSDPEMRVYAVAGLGALTAFTVDSFFETTWTSLSVVSTFFLLVGLGFTSRDERTPKDK